MRKYVCSLTVLLLASGLFAESVLVKKAATLRDAANGKAVGTVKIGETLDVIDTVGDYGKVTGMGKDAKYQDKQLEGWIYLGYVSSGTVTKAVTVRTMPDKAGEVLGQLEVGAKVTVAEVKPTWYKTAKGWIYSGMVEKKQEVKK